MAGFDFARGPVFSEGVQLVIGMIAFFAIIGVGTVGYILFKFAQLLVS